MILKWTRLVLGSFILWFLLFFFSTNRATLSFSSFYFFWFIITINTINKNPQHWLWRQLWILVCSLLPCRIWTLLNKNWQVFELLGYPIHLNIERVELHSTFSLHLVTEFSFQIVDCRCWLQLIKFSCLRRNFTSIYVFISSLQSVMIQQ